MTEPLEMKINYANVLQQLREEYAGLEERRQALAASIAAMKRLVDPEDDDGLMPTPMGYPPADSPPVRMPVIPPGFFSGKTPTQGYRDLTATYPGYYTPPQIADLFIGGGMTHKTRTDLVQAIHSVLKREKKRQAASGALSGLR
jgi:hypothetical protein